MNGEITQEELAGSTPIVTQDALAGSTPVTADDLQQSTPVGQEPSLTDKYSAIAQHVKDYLTHPTEKPTSSWDFVSRVLPQSLAKAGYSTAQMGEAIVNPYEFFKKNPPADLLAGMGETMAKSIALPAIYHTMRGDYTKANQEFEDSKAYWLQDPVGALMAASSWVLPFELAGEKAPIPKVAEETPKVETPPPADLELPPDLARMARERFARTAVAPEPEVAKGMMATPEKPPIPVKEEGPPKPSPFEREFPPSPISGVTQDVLDSAVPLTEPPLLEQLAGKPGEEYFKGERKLFPQPLEFEKGEAPPPEAAYHDVHGNIYSRGGELISEAPPKEAPVEEPKPLTEVERQAQMEDRIGTIDTQVEGLQKQLRFAQDAEIEAASRRETGLRGQRSEATKLIKEYGKPDDIQQQINDLQVEREKIIRQAKKAIKTGFGEQNKLFTKEAASEAAKRINNKGKTLFANPFSDPETLADMVKIGGFYLEGGIREFGAWSSHMVKVFGEEIKPHLQELYNRITSQKEGPDKPLIQKDTHEIETEEAARPLHDKAAELNQVLAQRLNRPLPVHIQQLLLDLRQGEEWKVRHLPDAEALDDALFSLHNNSVADMLVLKKWLEKNLPQQDNAVWEEVYRYDEAPTKTPLSPKAQEAYNNFYLPLKAETVRIRAKLYNADVQVFREAYPDVNLEEIDPATKQPKIFSIVGHPHRIVLDRGTQWDKILNGTDIISTAMRTSDPGGKPRRMMMLFDDEGNQQIVHIKSQKVTGWTDKRSFKMGSFNDERNVANKIDHKEFIDRKGKKWTVGEALTDDIEKHTKFQYSKNALLNAVLDYAGVRQIERNIDFMDSLKNHRHFKDIAIKAGTQTIPEGWRTVKFQQLRGYFFEPWTADALDSFYKDWQKGADWVTQVGNVVNHFAVNSIFWTPVFHPMNIAAMWAYFKGLDKLNPGEWGIEAEAMKRAIISVTQHDSKYVEHLRAGAAFKTAAYDTQNFIPMTLNKAGMYVMRDPGFVEWFSNKAGIPANLVKKYFEFTSKTAWYTHDILTQQAIIAQELRGVPTAEAIRNVERIIPNYRLPSRMWREAKLPEWVPKYGGADLSTTYPLSLFKSKWFLFGRWHYGELKALEQPLEAMIKNAPEARRTQAISQIAMLTALYLAYKKLVQPEVQKLLDNKAAYARYPGVLGLIDLAVTGDWDRFVHWMFVTEPVAYEAAQIALNRNFWNGEPVWDPSAPFMVKAKQAGGAMAKSAVAPVAEISDVISGRKSLKQLALDYVGIYGPKSTLTGRNFITSVNEVLRVRQGEFMDLISQGKIDEAMSMADDWNKEIDDASQEMARQRGMFWTPKSVERFKLHLPKNLPKAMMKHEFKKAFPYEERLFIPPPPGGR